MAALFPRKHELKVRGDVKVRVWILCFVLLVSGFFVSSASAERRIKCEIGRKCGWQIKYAPYAKRIAEYNLFLRALTGKLPNSKEIYKRMVSNERAEEALENQQEINILSRRYWNLKETPYGPMCKFRFKNQDDVWWTEEAYIKCSNP